MLANRFMTLPEPFESMVREMDQTVGDPNAHHPSASGRQAPVALWEDEDKLAVEIEVPGIGREDLDVTVHDGKLIVSGKRNPAQQTGKCWYNEQSYGTFQRMIALSDVVDTESVEAQLSDGILSVTLRKKPEAKPHRIVINHRDQGDRIRIETQHEETQQENADQSDQP